jgi:putative transposase
MYHDPNSSVAKRKINYKTKVKQSPSIINSGYLEIDTIALWVERVKAYVYHAIDVQNRFAFAYTYSKLNSQNTVDFLGKLKQAYPIESGIKTIQTDNGLEFMGDFNQKLKQEGVDHLFIYPRCPKINGFIERANRSLREEFLNHNQDLIIDDLVLFNQKLLDHLFWYNTIRPHQALNFLSPIDYLLKRYPESHMYVSRTLFV